MCATAFHGSSWTKLVSAPMEFSTDLVPAGNRSCQSKPRAGISSHSVDDSVPNGLRLTTTTTRSPVTGSTFRVGDSDRIVEMVKADVAQLLQRRMAPPDHIEQEVIHGSSDIPFDVAAL